MFESASNVVYAVRMEIVSEFTQDTIFRQKMMGSIRLFGRKEQWWLLLSKPILSPT